MFDRREAVFGRLGLWMLCGAVSAFAPLGADVLFRYRDGDPLIDVILRGQGLLVVVAASVSASGALLFSKADRRLIGVFTLFGLATLFLQGVMYALVASDPTPSKDFTITMTVVCLAFSFPIAAISIAAAKQ